MSGAGQTVEVSYIDLSETFSTICIYAGYLIRNSPISKGAYIGYLASGISNF